MARGNFVKLPALTGGACGEHAGQPFTNIPEILNMLISKAIHLKGFAIITKTR